MRCSSAIDPPQIAELKRLYVRPQGRGMGVGWALTEQAIDRARKVGYNTIRLDTLATCPMPKLYRKLGFKEIPLHIQPNTQRCVHGA